MSNLPKQNGVARLMIVYSLLIAGIVCAGFLVFCTHEKLIKSEKQSEIPLMVDLEADFTALFQHGHPAGLSDSSTLSFRGLPRLRQDRPTKNLASQAFAPMLPMLCKIKAECLR